MTGGAGSGSAVGRGSSRRAGQRPARPTRPTRAPGAALGREPPVGGKMSAQVRASLMLGAGVFACAGGALAAPAPPALLSRFLGEEGSGGGRRARADTAGGAVRAWAGRGATTGSGGRER